MRHVNVLIIPAAAVCFLSVVFIITGWAGTASARSRSEAAEGTVLAVGTASLKEGTPAAARKRALADALEKGVEEYLLRRLDGKAVAGQLSRFVQDLVPAARNEIANYNMLGEEEIEGGTYLVLVRVRVNEQTMEKTLEEAGFLRGEGPPVKVLFMVSQHASDGQEAVYWWKDPGSGEGLLPVELFLNRAFEDLGFSPAGRTMMAPEGDSSEELPGADLTLEEAAEWGRLCSAEVVVIGSCVLGGDLVSIHLRAIDVASESVIAEQGAQASPEDPERTREGIERAVKSVAAPLADRIREAFQPVESDPERFLLTLQGIGSFTLLQQFTRFLKEGVPGVESVTQTRFKGDTVTFSIGYREGADRFLEIMLNQPEPPFPLTARKSESGEIFVTPL